MGLSNPLSLMNRRDFVLPGGSGKGVGRPVSVLNHSLRTGTGRSVTAVLAMVSFPPEGVERVAMPKAI